MNLSQLNELDFKTIGQWPLSIKAFFAVLTAIIVGLLMYNMMISDQWDTLTREETREKELKDEYSRKYRLAANVEAYRDQMKVMEETFQNLLRILPASHETPGLLDDITYTGTNSGLQFKKINWEAEQPQEFYIELPIAIVVEGDYHQFGDFVADVSALPRIVTLHDFAIKRLESGKQEMSLKAKTYRYKEER